MKNRKKRNKFILLVVLLLAVSVGFAALSTTLRINGTTAISKNTWDIHWENVGNVKKTTSTNETIPVEIDEDDDEQVNFGVLFNMPGDYYEFEVDAVNAGTIDAMVEYQTTTVNGSPVSSLPYYIRYSITYADGNPILENHLLAKADTSTTPSTPTRERIKVKIEFLDTISSEDYDDIDPEGEEYVFDISLRYKQADGNAVPRISYDKYYTYNTNASGETIETDLSGVNTIYVHENTQANTKELCYSGGTSTVCFSPDSYDRSCNGGCTFDKNGPKTQALNAEFAAAGVTVISSDGGVFYGDSNEMCTGDASGMVNCFVHSPKYCYCSFSPNTEGTNYCGCYD